ncbi:CapA family protein [Actinomadura parmotrematis]|uniref:CapA family protein n=1 Tax=Actinomadura parmotrematis TaxID=2864039 RepID=A0ABS7FTP0_9ACTN|nr:CapA family protein [Actinomadura parmotrematis]MBW8482952.1 CapA family protein [Actinomadura parmotrematis]
MGRRSAVAALAAAATALAGTGCAALFEKPPAPRGPVTVAFGGDVHFEGALRARLDASPGTALGPVSALLSRADLAMVNLETAVTGGGTRAPKQFAFRAPATAFTALRGAGVDVATMANNHGMDYGPDGLRDSLAAARAAGFPVVGIGADAAAAFRPRVFTVRGVKIAFLGATQVLDDELAAAWTAGDGKPGLASAKDPARLVAAVGEARKSADVVVVDLHWGQELNGCPLPVQRDLAARLAAAGADAIVGGHAHVLLAGGYLKDAYVHYGLGNFAFYNTAGRTARSGVLTLTFDEVDGKPGRPVTKAAWDPALIEDGVPRPLAGAAAREATAQWEGLRGCADVKAAPPA